MPSAQPLCPSQPPLMMCTDAASLRPQCSGMSTSTTATRSWCPIPMQKVDPNTSTKIIAVRIISRPAGDEWRPRATRSVPPRSPRLSGYSVAYSWLMMSRRSTVRTRRTLRARFKGAALQSARAVGVHEYARILQTTKIKNRRANWCQTQSN